MRRKLPLGGSSWRGADHVAEWSTALRPAEPSRTPLPQVVLDSAFGRLAEQQPRLPHGPGHHAHVLEFDVSSLWPVSSAHRRDQPDQLAAPFQTGPGECARHQVGEQGVGGGNDVGAGNECREQQSRPGFEERFECLLVPVRQCGEARQRRPLCAVEGRRDAPHAATPGTELLLFETGVLDEAIGGIGDHGVNGVGLAGP